METIFNLTGILLGAIAGAFIALLRMETKDYKAKRNYFNNVLKFNNKIKDYGKD